MGIVVNMKTVENTVCELNDCSGCNACVNICPKKAIVIMDSIESYNAVINIVLRVETPYWHRVAEIEL